jgi:hypothetical protein
MILLKEKWSGRRDSNPQPPTWEGKYSTLYFQHLQNRPIKMCVHALHTVHALPDLRIAGGRFGGRFLSCVVVRNRRFKTHSFCTKQADIRGLDDKLSVARRPLPCQADPERLCLQHLQNCFGKMLLHTLDAMH